MERRGGRPLDQLGFGFTCYDVSAKLTRTERLHDVLGLPLTGNAKGIQTLRHRRRAELRHPCRDGVLILREIESFERPGATGRVHDTLVFGLKTHIDF